MSGLGAPEFRILAFWMAPWKTLKTSLKRHVSTHFRCPWAGGHKSLFQDGEYATFLSQFVHHRFLRYKPFWTPRITSQMYAEYENHDTKSWRGPPRRLREQICHVIFGASRKLPRNLRLSRQRVRYIFDTIFSRPFFTIQILRIPKVTLPICSKLEKHETKAAFV